MNMQCAGFSYIAAEDLHFCSLHAILISHIVKFLEFFVVISRTHHNWYRQLVKWALFSCLAFTFLTGVS